MTDLAETGAHNWQNYVDYWRDTDAEWLQARSILRVTAPADLSALPTPGIGQVVHVKDVAAGQKDVLFMYASVGPTGTVPGWVPYPALPKFLYASEDSASRVTLGHHPGNPSGVVPAIALSPQGMDVVSNFSVRTSIFKVTAADVQIKTGAATAVLTTNATDLVSSVRITAPGFTSSGPINAPSQAVTVGSVTAGTITSTGAISAQSAAITAAMTVGTTITTGSTQTGGLKSGNGHFFGDGNGAVIRVPGFAAGNAQLLVRGDHVWLEGGNTYMENQLLIRGGRSIYYYDAAGNHTGYGGPVIYSSAAPANPVNGTIWVIP